MEFRNAGITYGAAGAEALTGVSFLARPARPSASSAALAPESRRWFISFPGFTMPPRVRFWWTVWMCRSWTWRNCARGLQWSPRKRLLFRGTIRSNLLWGQENATEEALQTALTVAQAMEIVQGKEQGLDAVVEQGGGNLSGGQRQRLTIARRWSGSRKF